jgi:hypothetical protein
MALADLAKSSGFFNTICKFFHFLFYFNLFSISKCLYQFCKFLKIYVINHIANEKAFEYNKIQKNWLKIEFSIAF